MRAFNSTYIKPGPKGPRLRRTAALAALTWLMAGCGSTVAAYWPRFLKPYRPDVQQGNVITSDMVEQLRPGMTREQVKFMIGTPLLTDEFHPDRWDYLYYLNPRKGAPQRRNLVVYFKDNKLDHFTSDPMPPESMADNLILGRKGTPPGSTAPKPPAAPPASPPASAAPAEAAPSPTATPSEAPPAAPAAPPQQPPASPAAPPASSN
jgi:outer membrane protein assembly factor BamE